MGNRLSIAKSAPDAAKADRRSPFSHILRGAPPSDPVLDAAAICVDRKGFDSTSLEEVAVEAGVSRTTLYRRFGNREALFIALLNHRAKPFLAWSSEVVIGPGSAVDRIETVITGAILEMQQVGWLDLSLHGGMSASSIRLFKASHQHLSVQTIKPLLASMLDERTEQAGITVEEIDDWIVDQMLGLGRQAPWDEEALRQRVRYFVLSAIAPQRNEGSTAERRLAAIETRLDEISRKLDD